MTQCHLGVDVIPAQLGSFYMQMCQALSCLFHDNALSDTLLLFWSAQSKGVLFLKKKNLHYPTNLVSYTTWAKNNVLLCLCWLRSHLGHCSRECSCWEQLVFFETLEYVSPLIWKASSVPKTDWKVQAIFYSPYKLNTRILSVRTCKLNDNSSYFAELCEYLMNKMNE